MWRESLKAPSLDADAAKYTLPFLRPLFRGLVEEEMAVQVSSETYIAALPNSLLQLLGRDLAGALFVCVRILDSKWQK